MSVHYTEAHSLHFQEMAIRTDKHGKIENPDGYGKRTGDCGDTIEMYVSINDDCIESVHFEINGCINTNACSNTVALMAEGKNIEQAWEITPEKIIDYLETLPQAETHCAELAVGAFYLALRNAQEIKRDPWKKSYQKI